MKIFKKLILCLLIATLLSSSISISTFALDEQISTYDAGIELLKAIGVITNTDLELDPEEAVTKAEYAMLMVRLRGWEKLAYEQTQSRYFYDVDPEYYEARYVNLAAAMGLIEAERNSYFAPKQAITLNDAAKMLVTVLGYAPMAKGKGGAYKDYVAIATKEKLLTGVTSKGGKLTRGGVYRMLVNSLNVDVMVSTSYSKHIGYDIIEGNTLLSEYHKVYKDEGIITANGISALTKEGQLPAKNAVVINGKSYYTDNSAYHELLGYKVEYYYKADDNGFENIVFAFPKGNTTLTVKAADIVDFSNFNYKYLVNNKTNTANTRGAYFIYNGKAMHSGSNDYCPKVGHIELIDNDNNKVYDVVKIFSYEEHKVSTVNLNDSVIKTYENKRLDIEDEVQILFYPFDREVELKDIKADSIISVGKDSDGEITRIVMNQMHVIGEVTQMEKDDALWQITIDDVTYPVSYSLKTAILNGTMPDFEMGLESRFDLNYNNEVAYWDNNYKMIGESAWEFGLLRNAALNNFGNKLEIEVVTSTNQFEVLDIVSKVTIDDVRYRNLKEVYDKLCCDGENGTQQNAVVPQLIRFKLKDDGTIGYIDLVGDEDPTKDGLFKVDTYTDSMYYGSASLSLGGEITINYDTGLFIYPTSGGRIDLSDENKVFYERAQHYLKNMTSYTNFTTYKVASDQMPVSVICMSGTVAHTLSSGASLFMVLDIRYKINEDGDEVTEITYAQDNREVRKAIVASDVDINNIPVSDGTTHQLKKGDAFRAIVDSFGEIIYIQPIYDGVNHKPLGKNLVGNQTLAQTGYLRTLEAEQFYVGYAYKLKDDILQGKYSAHYSGDKTFSYNVKNVSILVYDKEAKTLTLGSQGDLYDYIGSGDKCSKLVIRSHWYDVKQFIIIK